MRWFESRLVELRELVETLVYASAVYIYRNSNSLSITSVKPLNLLN